MATRVRTPSDVTFVSSRKVILPSRELNMTSVASDQIYCLKRRDRTNSLEFQEVTLKNGRDSVTGRCATCGTKKFRLGAART